MEQEKWGGYVAVGHREPRIGVGGGPGVERMGGMEMEIDRPPGLFTTIFYFSSANKTSFVCVFIKNL